MKMFGNLGLAVLESRWENHAEWSVRPIYESLASLFCNNPSAFHYEMFNSDQSLKEMLPGVARTKGIRNIVVAAHGDKSGIAGARGQQISRAKLSHYIYDIDKDIEGLFLGCCEVGHIKNARFLLHDFGHPKGIQVQWVAGYRKRAGWLASAAFELLFWTLYFQELKRGGSTAMRIRRVCSKARKLASGLVDELGISLYLRDRGTMPGTGTPALTDLFAVTLAKKKKG